MKTNIKTIFFDNILCDNLSELFDITNGSVVSVVGCGGKTSLINQLARCNIDKKVLISPTTKIFPMTSPDVTQCYTVDECIKHEPHRGIQCLGQINETTGKLEALPEHILAKLTLKYDIVLLEADGSRSLPLKGWIDNEPVVPKFSTHTVGVASLDSLGCHATEENVHNLREFLLLTGLNEGDIITHDAVNAMIYSPVGMFKNAVGSKYVVIR